MTQCCIQIFTTAYKRLSVAYKDSALAAGERILTVFLLSSRDGGGHQALSWATWLLSTHPEVQERAYQEVCTVMGGDTDLEHISYEQVGGSVFDSPRGLGLRGCSIFCAKLL
jgi:hypothetical protein